MFLLDWLFSSPKPFSIEKVSLTYHVSQQDEIPKHPFWRAESRTWANEYNEGYVNITNEYRKSNGKYLTELFDNKPDEVIKIVVEIDYRLYGQNYTYACENKPVPVWPPIISKPAMPIMIKEAHLVDKKGENVEDVTERFVMLAGPDGNFHDEKVSIYDLLEYTREKLKEDVPVLSIKDIDDKIYNFETETDSIGYSDFQKARRFIPRVWKYITS